MVRKELLFIYPYMMMGGSTTSLLSVLNSINYDAFHVDILFYEKEGALSEYLPGEVHILPFACRYSDIRKLHMRKLFSLSSWRNGICGRILAKKTGNPWIRDQFGSKDNVRYCNAPEKEYDIAISYLEFWPMYYLAEKVQARKKIAWIHTDYGKLNLISKYENEIFKKLDRIVLISKDCRDIFVRCFPEWKNKTAVIENFISADLIRKQAAEKAEFSPDKRKINLITVCRIDFMSKGLDRAVKVVDRLVKAELEEKFHWYIIGDGDDYGRLEQLIAGKDLKDSITLLGAHRNPFPYEKQCDIFFLPSYFEGKPMSVSEAQILGIVPFVTNYSSSHEQIENGIDGVIVENNEDDIFLGLKGLLEEPHKISALREGVLRRTADSEGKIQFQKLISDE